MMKKHADKICQEAGVEMLSDFQLLERKGRN